MSQFILQASFPSTFLQHTDIQYIQTAIFRTILKYLFIISCLNEIQTQTTLRILKQSR